MWTTGIPPELQLVSRVIRMKTRRANRPKTQEDLAKAFVATGDRDSFEVRELKEKGKVTSLAFKIFLRPWL